MYSRYSQQRKYTRFDPYYRTPKKLFYQAKLLSNPTPEEQILWAKIKSRQLGCTFTRQKIILGYITDFYCQKYKLVIEVDGAGHDLEKDKKRTLALNEIGIYVLRFSNAAINDDLEQVIKTIKLKLKDSEKRYQEFQKKKNSIKRFR